MNNEIETIDIEERRQIIIVGKTGAGKSKILNELLCRNHDSSIFVSSADTESCTNKIDSNEWKRVYFNIDENNEISFELKAFDTPGIGDSKGRSIEFLNKIAQTIKETSLNLIIILVEYGKFDTGLYSNLEILRECLNDLSQSSSMLIINKVPTEKSLVKKRKNGEIIRNRQEVLDETFIKLSNALGTTFKYNHFLENDDLDGAEESNMKHYNQIKKVILSCSSRINTTNVKTWDEIVRLYSGGITENLIDDEFISKMTNLIEENTVKLGKIEFDIADIKYSFLNENEKSLGGLMFSSYHNLKSYVIKFDCKVTENEYKEKKKSYGYLNMMMKEGEMAVKNMTALRLIGLLTNDFETMSKFYQWKYTSIGERLQNLDVLRIKLKRELEDCQGSIDEQNRKLEEKKEKIIRLKSALVSPNQNSQTNLNE